MTIWEILSIVLALITIGLGIWARKSEKGKKWLENYLKIEDALKTFIAEAEKFDGLDGAAKKSYVINKIKEFIAGLNIQIDMEWIEELLENLIDFSKEVNKK